MIGRPSATPYVDEDDLAALAVEFGPGWVPVAILCDSYTRRAFQDPARVPMTKAKFARTLTEAGWPADTKNLKGVISRCRLIKTQVVRDAQVRLGLPDPADDPFASVEELEQKCARDPELDPDVWDGKD